MASFDGDIDAPMDIATHPFGTSHGLQHGIPIRVGSKRLVLQDVRLTTNERTQIFALAVSVIYDVEKHIVNLIVGPPDLCDDFPEEH